MADPERPSPKPETPDDGPGNFIFDLISEEQTRHARAIQTRFPPEPNGYLHIGHAKAICLNFGLADAFGGRCNLRFDDTNPIAEESHFVDAIRRDVGWLGFDTTGREYFASDYFDRLYAFAEEMVRAGKAYVDHQSLDEIRANRGDFYKPGVESPYRNRSVEQNLELLAQMKAGELEDGTCVLRAKIDMRSKDLKLRDPLMYRIRRVAHHRTGTAWSIYPMYDFAHGLSDAIEGVTHSLCSLEFKNHRALYDWFLEAVKIEDPPRQIEFARLNLTYTVLSKRKLRQLVERGHVDGWDDPRMPTLAGMRRRGFPPEAIVKFADRIGVSTRDSFVDVALLEHAVREELNRTSPRVMAVLNPLKVTLRNFEEGRVEWVEALYDPEKPDGPRRKVPLSRTLYIERDDFMETPVKKWFRLAPGREVRLRYGCLITCQEIRKDANGNVTEVICDWDPESLGGVAKDGRKVKGTLHWVSAEHAVGAKVRLYDRLFSAEHPEGDTEDDEAGYLGHLNPDSLSVTADAKLEPSLRDAKPGDRVQFERIGYFIVDDDSTKDAPVYNRTITLKDGWSVAKEQKKSGAPSGQ